ncbi:hypothetical protein [Agrobacterium sp. T29]|uniref:hypothetical protein n=1 Tax=Agrobacterium sp. T29 TaxID=2580515 RepID=UPI00115E9584|nr:hypothetical protein [Agrobacterium sp. T29]
MHDSQLKHLYTTLAPTKPNRRGQRIAGRCIGFKRHRPGSLLGGIYVFPHIDGKHLYEVNPRNLFEFIYIARVDQPVRTTTIFLPWVR